MEQAQMAPEEVLEDLSNRQQRSLQAEVGVAEPPEESVQSMVDVLDRWRLNLGWTPWDENTARMAAKSWIHTLNREKVPHAAYMELYERALGLRVKAINNGREMPKMCIELLLAGWPVLSREIREKEIEARNMLPATAESRCPRCGGTGLETVWSMTGICLGSGKRCDHRPLEEGEWLWKQQQRGRA